MIKKKAIFVLLFAIMFFPLIMAESTFYEGQEFFILQDPAQESGGGSGGGGSGSGSSCSPLWICEQWSSCSNNLRIRNCVDIKGCSTNENPPLLLSCSLPLPSDRITGCVKFKDMDFLLKGWKNNIYNFQVLNDAVNHWKRNLQC